MLSVKKRDGDYIGEDGRLFCGMCNQPREAFFTFEGMESMKHPTPCACEKARQAAAEADKKLHEHLDKVEQLRRRCFHDGIMKNASIEDSIVSQKIQDVCRRYVSYWSEAYQKGTGLILWGDVGTGKSYMASAIANELIEKECSVEIRDMGFYLNCRYEDRAERIESVAKPDLLVLDDMGIERDTGFSLETLFSVVDSRYRSNKPMIITTNIRLAAMHQSTDIHYRRIFDRILEVCVPVEFTGESLRKRKYRNNISDFQKLLYQKQQA